MMRLIFLLSLFFQNSATSSVRIPVADADGKPMPEVRVTLVLYEFSLTEIRETFSARCTTDAQGECTILIGETSGLLRGRLDLGKYGGRDVIWPGGALTAPVVIDVQNRRIKGTEAQPYDFQEKESALTIQKDSPWLLIFGAGLMLGGLVFWAYQRSRQEHAG